METAARRPSHLRRIFVVAWLCLSLLGAINHTILPDIFDRHGWLAAVFPHLKLGYVMFHKMPPRMPLANYRPRGEGEFHHVYELSRTPTYGYRVSRVSINVYFSLDYLDYLCRTNPMAEGALFRIQIFEVAEAQKLVETEYRECKDGVFRAGTL